MPETEFARPRKESKRGREHKNRIMNKYELDWKPSQWTMYS